MKHIYTLIVLTVISSHAVAESFLDLKLEGISLGMNKSEVGKIVDQMGDWDVNMSKHQGHLRKDANDGSFCNLDFRYDTKSDLVVEVTLKCQRMKDSRSASKVKEELIEKYGQPVIEAGSAITFTSNPSKTNRDELVELCIKEILNSGVVKGNTAKAKKMARRAVLGSYFTSRAMSTRIKQRVKETCPSITNKFSLLVEEGFSPHYKVRIQSINDEIKSMDKELLSKRPISTH